MADDNYYDTLDFTVTRQDSHHRGRYRVVTRGLSLYLDDVAQAFEISDLSSSGCSLRAPADLLVVGRISNCSLRIGKASYLEDLKLKIIRHIAKNSIACSFKELSRQQAILLDKLVLEIQKRNIANYTVWRKREKN